MRVLILDDDQARHLHFNRVYAGDDITTCFTAREAQRALLTKPRFDVVQLDHDLGMFAEGELIDGREATGRDVTRFIATLPEEKKPKQAIVHSWNPSGADAMVEDLRQAGVRAFAQRFKAQFTGR